MLNVRNCRIVLVRHGHTKYTEEFPDITNEGRTGLIQTAASISAFARYHQVRMFSSPKPRAKGSTLSLSSAMSIPSTGIVLEPDIRAVEQRQPEIVQRIIRKHAASKDTLAIEKAYWTEPEFNDPAIVEPRADIKKRFYRFLDRMIRIGLVRAKDIPDCFVCVSHAEVIGHIVGDIGEIVGYNLIPAVAFAQPVFLAFSKAGIDEPILIDYEFSGFAANNLEYRRLKQSAGFQ